MNVGGKYNSGLLFADFNQDFSCISIGTPEGYKIFNSDPFVNVFSHNEGGVGLVEMLFSTSLVAVVGAGDQPQQSPRRLQVLNTKTRQTICELNFVTAILKVLLNRRRLIVVMETKLHIYDISTMKILHTIDTAPNPRAICAFSPNIKNCFIAYPAGGTSPLPASSVSSGPGSSSSGPGSPAPGNSGDLFLFDALSLHTVNVIKAHKGAVSALAINQDGTLLASASEKGTVIRVYQLPNANKSWTFRRGTYPAVIQSLSFSVDSRLLCVASDTGTVHIFKLDLSSGSSTTSTYSAGYGLVASYLPEVISQAWEPARDFAHIKLPLPGCPVLCAISQPPITESSSSSSSTSPQQPPSSSSSSSTPPSTSSQPLSPGTTMMKVMVLTGDGFYYQYPIDTLVGGELKLAREYSLLTDLNTDDVTAKYVNV